VVGSSSLSKWMPSRFKSLRSGGSGRVQLVLVGPRYCCGGSRHLVGCLGVCRRWWPGWSVPSSNSWPPMCRLLEQAGCPHRQVLESGNGRMMARFARTESRCRSRDIDKARTGSTRSDPSVIPCVTASGGYAMKNPVSLTSFIQIAIVRTSRRRSTPGASCSTRRDQRSA
jgi:hypothetical protein